jgi:hypothetical protein
VPKLIPCLFTKRGSGGTEEPGGQCYDFKIFWTKNLAKLLPFLTQITANLAEKVSMTIVLRKSPNCRPEIDKIAKNCDHYIDNGF